MSFFMNNFFKSVTSIFTIKEKPSPKIKVCWKFLGKILGDLNVLTDEENDQLASLNHQDKTVLREIIREYIIPHYRYYPPENQEKIRNSLKYYLATNSGKLDWVFPSCHINFDPDCKVFYSMIWNELYGNDEFDVIDPDDYEEDCSAEYFLSLYGLDSLKGKYNPDGKKPAIANVMARIRS